MESVCPMLARVTQSPRSHSHSVTQSQSCLLPSHSHDRYYRITGCMPTVMSDLSVTGHQSVNSNQHVSLASGIIYQCVISNQYIVSITSPYHQSPMCVISHQYLTICHRSPMCVCHLSVCVTSHQSVPRCRRSLHQRQIFTPSVHQT